MLLFFSGCCILMVLFLLLYTTRTHYLSPQKSLPSRAMMRTVTVACWQCIDLSCTSSTVELSYRANTGSIPVSKRNCPWPEESLATPIPVLQEADRFLSLVNTRGVCVDNHRHVSYVNISRATGSCHQE